MKIKNSVEVTAKQLGLEFHNVALDSMSELELLQVLATLIGIQTDIVQLNQISKQNKTMQQDA